jgi:hypothetical protein
MSAGRYQPALARFAEAEHLAPHARLYPLATLLALAGHGRFDEVDARYDAVARDWGGEPRLGLAAAMIGVARGALGDAERVLDAPAWQLAAPVAESERAELLPSFPGVA